MAKEHVASNMEVLERAKKKVQSRVSDKLYNSIFLVIKILFLERGGGVLFHFDPDPAYLFHQKQISK